MTGRFRYPQRHLAVRCAIAIAGLCILEGCADSTVFMKNEATGQVVKCGGVHPITLAEQAFENREARCEQDYKEQGFVRIPSLDK